MTLIDAEKSQAWIRQFEIKDRPLASQILLTLRLVSLSEAESVIQKQIMEISESTDGKIALFPISKMVLKTAKRPRFGSEGRIGHLLENVERASRRYIVNPTVHSMRMQRVKHIVLVDDIIGSGKRLSRYFSREVDASVRSWLSFKYAKLWIVTYASLRWSVESLRKGNPYLAKAEFQAELQLQDIPKPWSDPRFKELFMKYGKRTHKGGAAFGFGGLPANLVFEWGIPNNAPAILWATGATWKPLFPNRGIPEDLKAYFGKQRQTVFNSEALWTTRQHDLALKLIDLAERPRSLEKRSELQLTILGLLEKRVKLEELTISLFATQSEISEAISLLKEAGFASSDGGITNFGRDLLARYRKKNVQQDSSMSNYNSNYFPKQFMGIQRD